MPGAAGADQRAVDLQPGRIAQRFEMGGGVIEFHDGIMCTRVRLVNGISRIIEIRVGSSCSRLTGNNISISLDIWNQNNAILALAALAQSTRLDVFRLLVKHEPDGLAAGDIAKALAVPQNTMSSHLAILSRAGLVTARRFSRSIVYRADLNALSGRGAVHAAGIVATGGRKSARR